MKKNGAIWYLLCILLCFSVTVSAAATTVSNASESSIAATNGCHSTDAQFAMLGSTELVKNVRSAFIYETTSDTLMYARNPDATEEPASLVKIMTALVAIENGNLQDAISVKQSVIDLIPRGMVTAHLVADEVLTLEDLLYCLVVGSASDAAVVIADHISGSQDAFVQHMNTRAAEIGCTGTYFTNTHGLYDKLQVTTARDTAKILEVALKNETFATIFGTVYYTVESTNKTDERYLVTNNYLMSQEDIRIYFDSRVTGGRTGVTQDGTRCIASTAEYDGMQLICVVMGSASEYNDDGYKVRSYGGFPETTSLLDLCFNDYKSVQVIHEGQVLTQCPVTNGANEVALGVKTSVSTVLPKNVTSKQLSFQYTDLTFAAPVTAGDPLSSVEIWYNNLCVGQVQLYAMNNVDAAGALLREVDDGAVDLWWLLPVIILIVLVVFLAINRQRVRRTVLIGFKKIRKRFHRNNRKRSR